MAGYMTRYWAVDQCKAFFGLSDDQERLVAGARGLAVMGELYDTVGPDAFYDHPLQILRQEYYHAQQDHLNYQHPGFWQAITPGGVVLDVGCGTAELGRLPWILPGHSYVGVESSKQVRQYVREKYRMASGFVVYPTLGAARRDYPVADALVCTDFFEHITQPVHALAAMWELLKPGGVALMRFDDSLPHPGHLPEAVVQIPEWWAWLQAHAEIVELETYLWLEKVQ